jgi:hypothetical protein
VLLQNEGFESLSGKSRTAAQAAKSSTDDNCIECIFPLLCLIPARKYVPVNRTDRKSAKESPDEVSAFKGVVWHDFVSLKLLFVICT